MIRERPQGVTPTGAKTGWCPYHCWVYPWHTCPIIAMTDADEAVALAELDAVSAATPAVLVYPRADTPPVSTAWYCSVFEWRTPNGWTIRVFNDCGEWDYVEELEAPDGRVWLYPHFVDDGRTWNALTEKLADWSPKPENEGGWPHIDECPP